MVDAKLPYPSQIWRKTHSYYLHLPSLWVNDHQKLVFVQLLSSSRLEKVWAILESLKQVNCTFQNFEFLNYYYRFHLIRAEQFEFMITNLKLIKNNLYYKGFRISY